MSIFIFILLVVFSAFFACAETSYFSVRHSQLRILVEQKKKNAELAYSLKNDPERLLITILIGNDIVNFAAASIATILGMSEFGSVGAGVATGAATFIVLIFGDLLPKTLAIENNIALSLAFAKPLRFIQIILSPLVSASLWIHHSFSSFVTAKKQPIVSEEEIRAMARLGLEHGEIDENEHRMIEKVFRFDDVKIGDIMTPMDKVEILDGDVPIEQIAYFVSQSGFSRFPVHNGSSAETIVGYIHVNQIMKALNSDDRERPVIDFISPIKVVSEERPVDSIFRSMQKSRHHLYLVHEEGGRKAVGIVTMENVLEEIVGEIKDETDD